MKLTEDLAREYESMFASCRVLPNRFAAVEDTITRMLRVRDQYHAIGQPLRIPWWWIAVIHQMECSGSFAKHLHNGDPLTGRTIQVPKGRPVEGKPPFTFAESATDALKLKRHDRWTNWTVAGVLWRLEGYNGFGYRRRSIPSPYLWSFSNHYEKGKFVADGQFDADAVSAQCGAAVLLKRMVDQHLIAIDGRTAASSSPAIERPVGRVRVSASALRVRSEPSTSAVILAKVNEGEVLDALAFGAEWARVRLRGGAVGWVSSRFVERLP